MKWYSVEKHVIPRHTKLIVRALDEKREEIYYTVSYVGGDCDQEITHFCIPDPIKFEEEKKS